MGGSPLPATLGRGGGAGPDGEASAGAGTRAGSRKRGGPAGLAVYPAGKTASARARVPARYRGGWCSGRPRCAGERGQDEKDVQLQGRRAGEAGRRDNRGRVGAASAEKGGAAGWGG